MNEFKIKYKIIGTNHPAIFGVFVEKKDGNYYNAKVVEVRLIDRETEIFMHYMSDNSWKRICYSYLDQCLRYIESIYKNKTVNLITITK